MKIDLHGDAQRQQVVDCMLLRIARRRIAVCDNTYLHSALFGIADGLYDIGMRQAVDGYIQAGRGAVIKLYQDGRRVLSRPGEECLDAGFSGLELQA